MELPTLPVGSLITIAVVLVALAIIGILIASWLKGRKDERDENGMIELSNTLTVDNDKLSKFVKDVPVNKREAVLKDLHNMDIKTIDKTLQDAKGGVLNDDENAVYRAFGMIRTQIRMGMFADYFKNLYHQTLTQFLSFLDPDELNKVNNIVSKYPKY